jgi:hypothetical protein
MLEMVKPEHKKMIIEKVNEAENFFKHADRDHRATLSFNPDMTELHMIDACAQYSKLTGEQPPLLIIYRAWIIANQPDLFIVSDELKRTLRADTTSIAKMGRAQFFSTYLPIMSTVVKG